jgi:hypothetical protein
MCCLVLLVWLSALIHEDMKCKWLAEVPRWLHVGVVPRRVWSLLGMRYVSVFGAKTRFKIRLLARSFRYEATELSLLFCFSKLFAKKIEKAREE